MRTKQMGTMFRANLSATEDALYCHAHQIGSLQRAMTRLCLGAFLAMFSVASGLAQPAFTWAQIRDRFESSNPTLLAGRISIDESRAQEITAFLRPNPDFTASIDQLDIFTPNPYRPLQFALPDFSTSYLHERQHKRELRLESAKKGTSVASSQQDDLERTLLFSLRNAFVQALQAKALLALARDNLAYYDRVLSLSQDRLTEGDIAKVDMQRLHLQRVQYESDVQTADVNVRTAKIQLLALLNDRTPLEQFDVMGPFEFSESIMPLDEFRRLALDSRPDLRAAVQSVDKARTDHQLATSNGSTDPTFGFDVAVQNPPIPVYVGLSVNIPLRIFDRNQGEKARTELDIQRNQRLQEAAAAQVYSDVDSAYNALNNSIALLRPYKAIYLDEAASVRDTISYSYQQGGASLLDFLQAQQDYRSVRVNYVNLVGSYLTAAAQLNLAVGREVIQ
jgi:cobalt-zinc-cadmium efflux system outer membrane protein